MVTVHTCETCLAVIAREREGVVMIEAWPVHAVSAGVECTCRNCGSVNLIRTRKEERKLVLQT